MMHMHSKMLAALAALALTTSLASAGCMAHSNDADESTDGQEELATGADDQATEKTGEADQACLGLGLGIGWGGIGCGGFGLGCGGFGLGCGGIGWSPCGWGCNGFGFGSGLGCGFGWGGFGGCW
jgi:hypothetical protein